MLHLVKKTNLIIKRTPLLCGLLAATVVALLPTAAQAQCANWNASGNMKILQRGQSLPIELTLEQKGVVISGTASLWLLSEGKGIQGKVDGALEGNSFSIQIFWNNWQIGVYNGKILPSGRLDGEGWEKNSPNVRLTWYSEGFLKCPPPPPVIPKPIKSSGKAKVVPAPPPTPPFLVASQSIFPTPYVPTGFVILTWDAGPDHPNAELWFKTPGGAYAFSKLPKAGLQVPVERGRQYEYMVTDAGKILAGVTFVAQ